MRLRFVIALFAVFSLVAAACGDSDSDSADSSGGDTTGASGSDAGGSGAGLDIDAILGADLANCAEAPSGDPIRVGMAMDFSDVVGFVDIPGSKLVPYVAELANCAGGVNGRPVEVRVAEVGEDAALATQELLDWGAQFLIGPPFADFALPILQTTDGKVPLFVAASTEPTLADASINSYLVTFDDNQMAGAAAQWAWDEGITRAIADQSRTIRLPVHVMEMVGKVARASRRMERIYGRLPTAEELAIAQRELGTITGVVTTEDLLGRIFASFCIGK